MAENKRVTLPVTGQTAKKLISHFKSEEEALKAIQQGRLAELASIPGVGLKTGQQILQKYWTQYEKITLRKMLTSGDIQRLHRSLWKIIQSFFQTPFGKAKLDLYYPLPSSKLPIIEERMKTFIEATQVASSLSDEKISDLQNILSKAKLLKTVVSARRISGRVILCDDSLVADELKSRRLQRFCPIYVIKPEEKINDYLNSYDLIVFVHAKNQFYPSALDYSDKVVLIPAENSQRLAVPEFLLSLYVDNYDTIQASCAFAENLTKLPDGPNIQEFQNSVDLDALRSVRSVLNQISPEGKIKGKINENLDRYSEAVENFDMILAETEVETNEKITQAVQERAVTIKGEQILKILQAASTGSSDSSQLKAYLPPEIADIVMSELDTAETRLCTRLKLTSKESEWAEGIIIRSIGLPIRMNKKKIESLSNTLRQQLRLEEFQVKFEMAKKLMAMEQTVNRAVQAMLEFDFFFGIGIFSKRFNLNPPQLDPTANGIGFKQAKSIFLMDQLGIDNTTPVDYVIGKVNTLSQSTEGERVVLLSGANSGGKTCLLRTILQILILGQSGFLVPAKHCEIGVFDEIVFYAKSQGMMSAGAFETSLNRLAEIILNPVKKFACFDEWEAATEAEAAARVVASALDLFAEGSDSCVLFVSHLAEQISQLTKAKIRIDGIEATGLDPNLSLLVSRTPRFNYLAKSMPELIITRLYRQSNAQFKEIYSRMLEALKRD